MTVMENEFVDDTAEEDDIIPNILNHKWENKKS